jgi:hypothetical protein
MNVPVQRFVNDGELSEEILAFSHSEWPGESGSLYANGEEH